MLGAVIYIVYVCKNILAKNSLIFLDNTPPMPVARGDRGGGGEAGGRGGVDRNSPLGHFVWLFDFLDTEICERNKKNLNKILLLDG